jgi:uncharacterized peroxidase-related enzyme
MTTVSEVLYAPVTMETAPEAAKPLLQKVLGNMGFVPNLVATLAHNPSALYGYLALDGTLQKGSFTGVERQLILLAASVENKCDYSIAAHSTSLKQLGASAEVVMQVREGDEVSDLRLNALVSLTREITRERGHASEQSLDRFFGAGYKKDQVMEVILGVATKTISNYLCHISPVALDHQFEAERVQVLTGNNGPVSRRSIADESNDGPLCFAGSQDEVFKDGAD